MTESWRGIHKLQEEMGELQQMLGKISVCPDGKHWSGEDIVQQMWDEIADVRAAIAYFENMNSNHLLAMRVHQRVCDKLQLFGKWVLTGIRHG